MDDETEVKQSEIIEFDEFKSKMLEFRKRYDDIVYDLNDKLQEKQAKSDRFAIGQVISALDKRHKEVKAPLAEKVALIDGERKRIKDQLLDVQGKIKSQIDDHNQRIAEHDTMLQAKVDEILYYANNTELLNDSAITLQKNLVKLENIVIDDSFENRKADALEAKEQSICKILDKYNERKSQEDVWEELAQLRKEKVQREIADREKQIAKRAGEEARKDAERISAQKEAAAQQRVKDAELAIERAQWQAKQAAQIERERIESNQRRIIEEMQAKRKIEEDMKAKAEYRNKVRDEAIDSLEHYMEIVADLETAATLIIDQIIDGKIKHVQLIY